MDKSLALHTAARRYCMSHDSSLDASAREEQYHMELRHLYDESQPWLEREGTDASWIFGSVLQRIEEAEPSDFHDVDALRSFLLAIPNRVIEQEVGREPDADEEQAELRQLWQDLDGYLAHVRGLPDEALRSIAPLPYRRYLKSQEVVRVWKRLEHAWGASPDRYWYPMLPPGVFKERDDVVAFDELVFYWHVGWEGLRQVLAANGVTRIFRLSRGNFGGEYELDVELDVELLEVRGNETYWTSETTDWLLYVSHEQSVTVGGTWLLNEIKQTWPSWESGLSFYQTGVWPAELSERLNF